MAQVVVNGSVYGGGNAADVKINTTVHIETGQVKGNVYGGGKQGDVGRIDKSDQTTYNYKWTDATAEPYTYNNTGLCTVEILGGTIGDADISTANHASGHVFGAGEGDDYNYWCEKGMVYKTSVNISKGMVYGNVYGGGEVGRVENDTRVTIGPESGTDVPEIKGSVFGAGAGLETHGYSALVRNNSYVTVQGYAKVRQNVYGGGEVATVGRYWVNTNPLPVGAPQPPTGWPQDMPYQQRSGGLCTVIIKGHAEIGPKDAAASETAGHVYGAGKGATPGNVETAQKMPQNGTLVGFTGETAQADYFQFLETLALATHTDVTIGETNGGVTVKGSVYGGSENGFVQHNASVAVQNGCSIGATDSYGDVYGGGKGYAGFAAAGRVTGHATIEVAGGTAYGSVYGGGELGVTKGGVNVTISSGEVKKDVYGGGALADTNADDYELVFGLTSTSSVKGLYTKTSGTSGDTYTEITEETTAQDGTEYYRKTATSVDLTGGIINGDVYGGGLGRQEVKSGETVTTEGIAALVNGDVTVNLNYNSGTCQINGSVFGCNNLNGTPKGDVEVNVYGTKGSVDKSTDENKLNYLTATDAQVDGKTYDLQGVYGGGNLATYNPNDGKSTTVNIYGCNKASIKEVYGGGNAADVPSCAVNVNGAYEIGYVYGGGNGRKEGVNGATSDAAANVNGDATTTIRGGTIYRTFGGSNTNGTITGTATLDIADATGTGACDLCLGDVFSYGNRATMSSPATVTLGCLAHKVGALYGGAMNADVNNDITLTINGGTYGSVFGGNKSSGAINGSITVNIQQTDCDINIDNLYGCGNEAAYSTPSGKNHPQINVISCTSIGNIYGGGLGSPAVVTGNPSVNINMEKVGERTTYGTIGSVYGGGSAADVVGNTTVNVATAAEGKGANITGSVYGGGYGASTTVTGNVAVNVGGQTDAGAFVGDIAIGGSVYGGSAMGAVNASTTKDATTGNITAYTPTSNATTTVTLKKGNITGKIFGGGMGEEPSGSNTSGTVAKAYGNATVTLYGDVVAGGLYGGCDLNGRMFGNTILNLFGGRVGAELGASDPVPDMVFGGGLGQYTYVDGNVTVNVGSKDYTGSTSTTIWGNVYGGSARGDVNTGTAGSTPFTTTVNLFKGTVHGNVFGGGLGVAAVGEPGADGYKAPIPATVKGDIEVNLNGYNGIDINDDTKFGTCVVTGNIFGCNNTYGSPEGDVNVHIYKTVVLDNGSVAAKPTLNTKAYEMQRVFGGGNNAPFTTANKTSSVIIETCKVSIEEVYGGGYGATSNATKVEVKGAYEIGTVFGGGYGAGEGNPGADVETTAEVILKGGVIHEVYGGSNTRGDVKESATVNVSEDGTGCCDLAVDNIYGAGKNASMSGDVNIVMGCQPDRLIEEIYAGSKRADVDGNVNLTITSGKFGRVFGGNKYSGALKGSITVNIEETGGCDVPIIIGELYAGGNLADYSIYGYNATTGKAVESGETALYNDPKLNIRSFTSIGKVFGGGYKALMVANPTVNINVAKGSKKNYVLAAGSFDFDAKADDGTVEEAGLSLAYPAHAEGAIGTIGDVYGGGNLAKIIGSATVNIGTEKRVQLISLPKVDAVSGDPEYDANATQQPKVYQRLDVEGANITGNVYGGGNLADVTGNTQVNICTKYDEDDDEWESVTYGTGLTGVTIGSAGINDDDHGNVYGGGKGLADNFLCNKAMVGTNDAGLQAGYSDGNTSVIIGNGTVNGNVYGGGEIGRVEMNTTVTIGLPGEGTSSPDIKGDVFGGGKGDKEHGYAGLVRGNPTVTIQANAKVEHNVYGGGEIASVARYKVPRNEDDLATAHSEGYIDAVIGRPYALKDANSGFCTVTVRGNAVIGPDYAMEMTKAGGPDDTGHVFGAGKGIMPENYDYASNTVEHKPRCRANDDSWTWFADIDEYIAFIQTLALSSQTTVNIGDANDSNSKPFVKGSVYGGSENGLVQFDTNVNIIGGQIGCGKNANGQPHPDGIWADNYVPDGTDYECASWNYGKVEVNGDNRKTIYAPYDPFANAEGDLDKYPQVGTQAAKSTEGGRRIATDGHTYYGNVFGGGSGSVPYFDTTEGISKYLNSAGTVKGNTNVTISGGHILTSVYGGCEATNVLGTANVTMTGGTIGVPRKDEQILAHPVTCNLFGAGKGDQRVFFNKDTNVENAVIQINGGRIYGSVFGGGEDGHVMKNVTLTIEEKNNKTVKIGSAGTSYMDGNVFGGGRGFGGDALTAGNVGGTVTLNIKSGSVLGSVYGGGRLASVGYGLYLTTETGFGENHDDGYGKMQEDGYSDWTKGDNNEYTRTAISGFKRGYINVNISGGTIGNTVANAQYGGNVFGGSMGSIVKQDGTVNTQWDKFATAKKTTVNVTGGTIMRSVYGGGEMGTVTTDAIVNVSGGTIGDANHGGAEFGNVYGGGKGYVDPAGINYIEAGIIKGNTNVTISETDATKPTTIYHNVYGGGAYGSVGTITRNDANYVHVPGQTSVSDMPESWAENTGSSEVRVLGGTIGRNGNENGMVFGSSRGDVGAPGEIHDKLAWVKKAKVVIGATGTTGPNIKGSVYGSGENGHLFQDAVVEIHSGVVGIAEGEPIGSYTAGGASYPYRGNVYGGGCGTDKYYSNPTGVANPHDGKGDKYNPLAGIVLGDASVTMDGGTVVHNIYGAGAMGSVGTMTTDENNHLVISSGGKTTIDISGGTVGVDGIVRDDGNSNGNVFGAARGDVDTDQTDVALVKTTEVTISQAEGKTTYVWGNVYGGGETGDVGTYYTITEEGANKGTNAYLGGSGACVVEVTGGTVHHNVFGAGKGESSKYECKKAMVSSTDVTIDTNAKVNGNVYGGGEVGRVEYNTVVKIGSGAGAETGGTSKPEIGGSVYGAGAGLETHGYSALVRGNSTVTVEGNAKVNGNVYGGGETATVGKYWVSLVAQDPNEAPPSGFPDGMPYKTRDGGICTVNIQGYAQVGPDAGGSKNAGNVFGAGKGVEPSYSAGESQRMKNGDAWEKFTAEDKYLEFLQTLALASVTNVTVDGNAKVKGSVYGGSESGFVQDESFVTIKNGEIGTATYGDIYGGGRGLSNFAEAGRVKGGVTIAVDGGTAFGSVYGGGELGIVTGAVLVNINNGIVEKDVYGGGALANTNTNNWNGTTLTETYLEVGGLIAGTSSVVGYYTKSGDNYTLLTTGKAVAGTKYYRKVNTTVNLLGGKIYGDAYGGGLGDLATRGTGHSDVAALVYGDVFVTLDGTAFDITKYEGKDIVKSGRVFGCNNLNGSPKGDVTVTVNKTVTTASGVKRTTADSSTGRPPMGEGVNVARSYELAAVYGGGNLADYEAEGTGRKTHVIINSCDVSINQVYGGGNAAKVPETDVLVNGAYEIHQVFGGGNGADMYTLDNGASWKVNPGADIDGNANTLMKGGYIHEAYGGSNEKGTITGNITIDTGAGGLAACPVQVDKLVGAGKNADVNGNLIIILGCKDNTKIPIVYGGADNARLPVVALDRCLVVIT